MEPSNTRQPDPVSGRSSPEGQPLWLESSNMAVATDLYELTMMSGYQALGRSEPATFEVFTRRLAPARGCLIACGLEQVVHYLRNLRFSSSSLAILKTNPDLAGAPAEFWSYLEQFRFTGDLWALPEGTPFFANEPILRITAPLPEAQLLESYILSVLTPQISAASKAARIAEAARGKPVFEFAMRRAAGPQAALAAARASYISGFAGTSCVLASQLLDIPAIGTMAHSWIMSFADEQEAFNEFRRVHPTSMLLIDTYDTILGARRAAATGPGLSGVRIDSGDLSLLSQKVRKILDESGQPQAKIVVSGSLNETSIRQLELQGAPIDGYAVGGELVAPKDAPGVDLVYKLVEIADAGNKFRPVSKNSTRKGTLAGRKQVFRLRDNSGHYLQDVIGLAGESADSVREYYPGTGWLMEAEPLLIPVMKDGRLLEALPDLNQLREQAREKRHLLGEEFFITGLPDSHQCDYRVEISKMLRSLQPQTPAQT